MQLLWRTDLDFPKASLAQVQAVLSAWLSAPKREPSFSGIFTGGDFSFPGGGRLLVDEAKGAGPDCWALRYERAIQHQGLAWITDVWVHQHDGGLQGAASLRCALLRGGKPKIDRIDVQLPAFMIGFRDAGLFGSAMFQLRSIDETAAGPFVASVSDPKRKVPLVAVSVEPHSEKPLANPTVLQESLIGVAQVVLLSKGASLALPRLFEQAGTSKAHGRAWGVFGGAIRVYRPQTSLTASPFEHPLHLPDDVQAPDFFSGLKDWCWSLAALQGDAGGLDVDAIRADRRRALFEKGITESGEWAEYCALEAKKASDELASFSERCDELAMKNHELEIKNQALQYQLAKKNTEDEVLETIADEQLEGVTSIAYFCTSGGRRPVLDLVDSLDVDSRTTALRALADLPNVLRVPVNKAVGKIKGGSPESARGRLWEFRINTKDFWVRLFFARAAETPGEILLLSGYRKKQNELDEGEIDKAAAALRTAWDMGWK